MSQRRLVLAAGVVVWATVVRARSQRRAVADGLRRDRQQPSPRLPPPGELRLSVVLPAIDEEEGIATTVARVRADLAPVADDGGLEVIVVDDGSTDATAARARAAGADAVLVLPVNRGKGAAVRTGVLAARGRTVAFLDADLAYAPDHLLALLAEVESGWDVVVGSRRHTHTTTLVRAGRVRELGGRAINGLTHAVLGGRYRDTQCGLKAFRADAARSLFAAGRIDRFAFDVELFHLAERQRLSLTEVPVRVANSTRSSVRIAHDALGLVVDLLRIKRWARAGVYERATELDRLGEAAQPRPPTPPSHPHTPPSAALGGAAPPVARRMGEAQAGGGRPKQ